MHGDLMTGGRAVNNALALSPDQSTRFQADLLLGHRYSEYIPPAGSIRYRVTILARLMVALVYSASAHPEPTWPQGICERVPTFPAGNITSGEANVAVARSTTCRAEEPNAC